MFSLSKKMKQKLADFLVRKNKIILIVFIVLALGCAALIPPAILSLLDRFIVKKESVPADSR